MANKRYGRISIDIPDLTDPVVLPVTCRCSVPWISDELPETGVQVAQATVQVTAGSTTFATFYSDVRTALRNELQNSGQGSHTFVYDETVI